MVYSAILGLNLERKTLLLMSGKSGKNIPLATLAGLSSLSLGVHACRASMTVLMVYLVANDEITPFGYSCLQASNSFPALFIPFLSGQLLTRYGYWKMTFIYLSLTVVGQLLFAISIFGGGDLFWLSALGQLIFGIGACCVVVAQRSLISLKTPDSASFATGSYVAMAGFGKVVGKSATAPAAEMFGYKETTFICAGFCLLSLSIAIYTSIYGSDKLAEDYYHGYAVAEEGEEGEMLLVTQASSGRSLVKQLAPRSNEAHKGPREAQDISPSIPSLEELHRMQRDIILQKGEVSILGWERLVDLPYEFWTVVVLHAIFLLVFHVLANFLPHYIVTKWGVGVVQAGLLASLSSMTSMVVAPLVGLYIDLQGRHIPVSLGAGIVTSAAYGLLCFTHVAPLVPISMIALAQASVPTVLLSTLPLFMPSRLFGLGFGMIESGDAVCNLVGNMAFGGLYELSGTYDTGLHVLFAFSLLACAMLASLIFLAYRWERVNLYDETVIAYDSPQLSNVKAARRGSKELMGLSDNDRRRYASNSAQIEQHTMSPLMAGGRRRDYGASSGEV